MKLPAWDSPLAKAVAAADAAAVERILSDTRVGVLLGEAVCAAAATGQLVLLERLLCLCEVDINDAVLGPRWCGCVRIEPAETALSLAAAAGHEAVVARLLRAAADPRADNFVALLRAAAGRRTAVVDLLLADARISPAVRALLSAAAIGNVEALRSALESAEAEAHAGVAACIAAAAGKVAATHALLSDAAGAGFSDQLLVAAAGSGSPELSTLPGFRACWSNTDVARAGGRSGSVPVLARLLAPLTMEQHACSDTCPGCARFAWAAAEAAARHGYRDCAAFAADAAARAEAAGHYPRLRDQRLAGLDPSSRLQAAPPLEDLQLAALALAAQGWHDLAQRVLARLRESGSAAAAAALAFAAAAARGAAKAGAVAEVDALLEAAATLRDVPGELAPAQACAAAAVTGFGEAGNAAQLQRLLARGLAGAAALRRRDVWLPVAHGGSVLALQAIISVAVSALANLEPGDVPSVAAAGHSDMTLHLRRASAVWFGGEALLATAAWYDQFQTVDALLAAGDDVSQLCDDCNNNVGMTAWLLQRPDLELFPGQQVRLLRRAACGPQGGALETALACPRIDSAAHAGEAVEAALGADSAECLDVLLCDRRVRLPSAADPRLGRYFAGVARTSWSEVRPAVRRFMASPRVLLAGLVPAEALPAARTALAEHAWSRRRMALLARALSGADMDARQL